MARDVIDDVVYDSMQKRGNVQLAQELRGRGNRVREPGPKLTLQKSSFGLSQLGYFSQLEKTYESTELQGEMECIIDVEQGEGKSPKSFRVSEPVFRLAKTLAFEQVSKSSDYSDAVSKIFLQFMAQIFRGASEYNFTEDPEWPRIVRLFFRYVVDFVCEKLGQPKKIWEIIGEEQRDGSV